MGGWQQKVIVGYQNEDFFQACTSPLTTILRREDVMEVIPPTRTQIEVPLTAPTWRIYQEMRKDLVAWLSTNESASAAHAGAKVMRLAQIVNGLVGGLQVTAQGDVLEAPSAHTPTKIIGREKLDALLTHFGTSGWPDKLVIFARFRPDVERLARELAEVLPTHEVSRLYGEVGREERRRTKELFIVGGDPRPAVAVINAQSGGAGLNLAASTIAVFFGHEYSLRLRDQAEQRIQGPDTTDTTYLDILATGPKGERTIDHVILAAQRAQEDTATWTANLWRQALDTEESIL